MKKALAVLFTLVMLISTMTAMTLSSSADTLQSGTLGNLTWTLNETTGELTVSGEGEMGDLGFASAWRGYKDFIKSVTICDGITSISNRAFSSCGALASIEISDSVTSIGDCAFMDCVSLTDITIPDSVTSIGDYVFEGCRFLTSIEIPDGVTRIGDGIFSGCKSLTSIEIPNGVTTIGSLAFFMCESLLEVKIPDSVTLIGSWAFYECSSLCNIIFEGPSEKWYAINKGTEWDFGVYAQITFCPHVHTYGDWTDHNDTKHKKMCECGVTIEADHAWNNGEITTSATHTAEGVKTFACEDCKATKTEIIDKLPDHTWGEWSDHNDIQHKKECTCGNVVYEDHTTANGVCTACGKTMQTNNGSTNDDSSNSNSNNNTSNNTSNNDDASEKNASGCSSSASGVLFIVPMLGAAAFMVRKKKKQ